MHAIQDGEAEGPAHARILTGGEGRPRACRIAARWADEFNLSSTGPDLAIEKMTALDAACQHNVATVGAAVEGAGAASTGAEVISIVRSAEAFEQTRRAAAVVVTTTSAAAGASDR